MEERDYGDFFLLVLFICERHLKETNTKYT